eukprot:6179305-Pleurochrysis_carterae.AAC.2
MTQAAATEMSNLPGTGWSSTSRNECCLVVQENTRSGCIRGAKQRSRCLSSLEEIHIPTKTLAGSSEQFAKAIGGCTFHVWFAI